MAESFKPLAQLEATGGNTIDAVYAPGAGVDCIVRYITVVNNSDETAATIRFYVGGSALVNMVHTDTVLQPKDTFESHAYYPLTDAYGFYIQSTLEDAVAITLFGWENS